jgi:putative transposase
MLAQSIDKACVRYAMSLIAFVFLPEHVHLLVYPWKQKPRIDKFLAAIKRPVSFKIKQILQQLGSPLLKKLTIRERPGKRVFRFWQEGPGYDRNLRTVNAILAAMDYIHQNPVRRGLCNRAIDWKWSSARFYLEPDYTGDPDLPTIGPLPQGLAVEWPDARWPRTR